MTFTSLFHRITFDGLSIMVTDNETVHVYSANQEQLCDILEYEHTFHIEKVTENKHEILESVNGECFYSWSIDELFECVNSGQLVLMDTKPYYNTTDILISLFNHFK